MKQCIIGDIHQRLVWRRIVEEEKDADRFIFLGDYLDSHDHDLSPIEAANNLENIIKFKKEKVAQGKEVVLLLGNHCYHYLPGVTEYYSGYQPQMRATFESIYKENMDLFQICFIDEHKTIYSHAGITETFLDRCAIHMSPEATVAMLNKLFNKPIGKTLFGFHYGDRSGCGDDIRQGPLWVRPNSLWKDGISNLQVVGHTTVGQINHPTKSERRGFYLADALGSRMYLVCIDGKFEVKQLGR
jgi:hypothetical protein